MADATNNRRPFVLLDPPSGDKFARRAALREKEDAAAAAFPSIDLILLSGSVRAAGFEPVFIDAQLDRMSWDDLADRLDELRPAGLLSLVSSAHVESELAQLGRVQSSVGGLKCYIVGTIVLQQQAGVVQSLLETNPWLDGIVLNTAEHNLTEHLAAASCDSVEPFNIARRVGSEVVIPTVQVRYGESLRLPQPEHALFKDSRYSFPQSKRGPVTCTQFSFGCPFTCEFCIDNQQYRKMLYRDVDDFVEELVRIDELGFREVYFKDLTFGLNASITRSMLEKLASRRLRLRWLCTTRIDVAKPELLALMRRAGCYGVEFGIEHAKESVRRRVDKNISEERIRSVLANCRKLDIESTAFIMLAFEDDTEQDVKDTITFANSLGADYVSFNLVNALPGTAYEARARREGFLREGSSDLSFAVSNIKNKHLSQERVAELHREAVRSFYLRPKNMLRRALGIRSVFELRKLIRLGRASVLGV